MKIVKSIVMAFVLSAFAAGAYAADCSGIYKDNKNGTVTDCRTGLVWLKDANCKQTSNGVSKQNSTLALRPAMKWAKGLRHGVCGLTDGSSAGDWRLPTRKEWVAMIKDAKGKGYRKPVLTNAAGSAQWKNGDAFINVQSGRYWSTTKGPLGDDAWGVEMGGGGINAGEITYDEYIWPVRKGK
jgi:hypothetical protein